MNQSSQGQASDDRVLAALAEVVADHGWPAEPDARRLRAALSDLLGVHADEHRRDLEALVVSVEEGIAGEVRRAGREGADALAPDMADRLSVWGLAPERAHWVVQAWVRMLPEITQPPAQPVNTAQPVETAQPADTAEPPDTKRPVGPTTLPPSSTSETGGAAGQPVRPLEPTELPDSRPGPADVTMLPPDGSPEAASAASSGRTGRRTVAVLAATVLLAGGGVAAALSMTDDESAPPEAGKITDSEAGTPAAGTELVAAPESEIAAAGGRFAMASKAGGVQLTGLGEVEEIPVGEETLAEPEGGRLLGFRLGDWPCDADKCQSWDKLGLKVAVGDDVRRLPVDAQSDTFVVAVPAGVENVDLLMRANGLTQSLSLVDGEPDPGNIQVLARENRSVKIDEQFTLTEKTSRAFDYGGGVVTDTVPRKVNVSRAELVYFTEHGNPGDPAMAYLKVRAEYSIPLGSFAGESYAFDVRELMFTADDGERFKAKDLDKGEGINAVFEVPADLRGGTLRLGGVTYPASSGGTSYDVTLSAHNVKISFD